MVAKWLALLCSMLFGCAWAAEDPYAAEQCQDREEVRAVHIVRAPAPAVAVAQTGYVTIVCAPRCDEIFAGGRPFGPSPLIEVPVAVGEHRFELHGPGGVTRTVVVAVEPDRVTKRRIALFRHHAGRKWRHHHRHRFSD